VQTFAEEIAGAGRRMNSMIGGLLDFARNARHDLNKTDVDMSTMASKLVEQLRSAGHYPSLELIITPRMRAHADASQMEVVLSRLLDNAFKYSARSDPPRIRFGKIDYEDGASTFFVRDNGVGFDEALSARLFAPFQRLHGEHEYAGHGVGLATVARIIMRHGGRVWAEGRPGEGATFFFSVQPTSRS
jgi:light-regulated signal transduction histidine kinase (bacteriophytochrome)